MDARPRPSRAAHLRDPSQVLRSRSRSPSHSSLSANHYEESWQRSARHESEESRQRLARHEGANRSLQPAWMSRGIGVNKEILGETRGDLVKPGLTQADLDEMERKAQQPRSSPDGLDEFFNSRNDSKAGSQVQQGSSRADPLSEFFDSRDGAKEQQQSNNAPDALGEFFTTRHDVADPLNDFFDSRNDSKVQQRSRSPDALGEFFDSRRDAKEQQQSNNAPDALGEFFTTRHDAADPLNEFFDSRNDSKVQQRSRSPDPKHRWEHESWRDSPIGSSRQSANESWHDSQEKWSQPPSANESWHDSQEKWSQPPDGTNDDSHQVLIKLVRHALSEGGFMQGHRLGELLNRHHRDICSQAKTRFGAKGWIATMVHEATSDIKMAHLPEHGGPVFYIDSEGNGKVPSHQAPAIIGGDRVPVKGNAKFLRDQERKKKGRGKSPDLSPDRRRVHTPEPERSVPPGQQAIEGDDRRVRTPEPERYVQQKPTSGHSASSAYEPGRRRDPEEFGSPPRERSPEKEQGKSVWDLL